MPHRLGPCLFGPPFSNEWQARQTFADDCPRSALELASRTSIGCDSCGFCSPVLCSCTAISKPGLAGFSGLKTAPAAIFSATRPRQVDSTAIRILLVKSESIAEQLRRWCVAERGSLRAPLAAHN